MKSDIMSKVFVVFWILGGNSVRVYGADSNLRGLQGPSCETIGYICGITYKSGNKNNYCFGCCFDKGCDNMHSQGCEDSCRQEIG